MPHAFAVSFQEAARVVERSSVEKADIHMRTEGVDVAKRRISHARGGMAIVQKLANVRSAAAHPLKPRLADPSHLVIGLGKPSVNAGVSLNGAGKSQELAHQTRLAARRVMSRRRWRNFTGRAASSTLSPPSAAQRISPGGPALAPDGRPFKRLSAVDDAAKRLDNPQWMCNMQSSAARRCPLPPLTDPRHEAFAVAEPGARTARPPMSKPVSRRIAAEGANWRRSPRSRRGSPSWSGKAR